MNADQLRDLTRRVLMDIGLHSPAAENLLMGTFAQESHLGEYIRQIRGPALGIGQMEPASHDDLWKNYLAYKTDRPWFRAMLRYIPHERQPPPGPEHLEWNLAYAICMTRFHYLRRPEPLPDANDVWALAAYWKTWYNTPLGRGTEREFVVNYGRFIAIA